MSNPFDAVQFAPETLQERLEKIVDTHALREVLHVLSDICHLKAEHIRVEWQDDILAGAWTRAGKAVNSAYSVAMRMSL